MDAVEFFKTVKRLCKNQGCDGCPVCKNDTCMVMLMARIYGASDESIEETISKVEQWAKDHPGKTRKSEFQKMFPNANMYSITTTFCTAHFDKKKACEVSVPSEEMCEKCRYKYWNEEVTDND